MSVFSEALNFYDRLYCFILVRSDAKVEHLLEIVQRGAELLPRHYTALVVRSHHKVRHLL